MLLPGSKALSDAQRRGGEHVLPERDPDLRPERQFTVHPEHQRTLVHLACPSGTEPGARAQAETGQRDDDVR